MKPAERAIVNTAAQHIRSILNVCLSLYSTRLVLVALGEESFGTYSLVAGVVVMLGFFTNAMVVTTQRYLSFYYGKEQQDRIKAFFSNSLFLHIVIGIVAMALLVCLTPLVSTFNIAPEQMSAAKKVYLLMTLSLFFSFLAAPYRALFIARENIVYISIIDVLDGVLKLLLAIVLLRVNGDRLVVYACMMVSIMAFNYLAFALYAHAKFEEGLLIPRWKSIDGRILKEMGGFAGWTIYSMGCVIGRTQGTHVILNNFFGTIINSAYGLSQQVFNAVQFVASAVVHAMSPQVVKAEGANDRQRMLALAATTSKFAYLLLAIIAIPIVFEMPNILKVWLKEVPEHCDTFCRIILIASLLDQTTIGLNIANQATGRIRNYSLVINTMKLSTLFFIWVTLYKGYSVMLAMLWFAIIELTCALIRLPFLKITAGLSVRDFLNRVFLRIIPPTAVLCLVSWLMTTQTDFPFRFLLTLAVAIASGVAAVWTTSLTCEEKDMARQLAGVVATKITTKK